MWMRKAGGGFPSRFIEAKIIRGLLSQAMHVEHVVEPGRLALQPLRRAQGAKGVRGAALRAHRDFDPLAGTGEHHRVLADDVAAADGVVRDLLDRALAGLTLAAEGEILLLEDPGDKLAQLQRGARRRVDLVAVGGLARLHALAPPPPLP